MKRLICIFAMLTATVAASAQNTQTAAAEAAAALSTAEDVPQAEEKPKYWTNTLVTSLSFGQTYLSQWAAGGYNNYSLSGSVDGTAKYAKDKLLGNTRLQLDYGQMYSADKPILQKTKDRIYLESKWGLETPVKHLAYSASFDFKTQFGKNYGYGTPKANGEDEPTRQDWLDARTLKSGFLAPAYINLGLGVLWTPAPWFSLNFAPLTGGAVIVTIPELRYTYGMELLDGSSDAAARKAAQNEGDYSQFRGARFELGAQLKADASWVINEVFTYNTQVALFYNYLKPKYEPRVTWDNKITWKMTKFFGIMLTTNLIYDPFVMVRDTDDDGKGDTKGVQFKEYFELGFTYTLSHNR